MARIRTIKPDVWEDEAIGRVSRDARLLFIGLITQADDDGRLRGDLRLLRAKIYPYDEGLTAKEIQSWIDELAGLGLVQVYERGYTYLCLPSFRDNQVINKPVPSRIPAPDAGETVIREDYGSPTVGLREDYDGEGKGREGKGTSGKSPDDASISRENNPLSFLLADLVEGNGSKRPTVSKEWARDERLLISKDGRDPKLAEALIRWAQDDEFWRSNVLSMPKFRKQFDRLRLQYERDLKAPSKGPTSADLDAFNEE